MTVASVSGLPFFKVCGAGNDFVLIDARAVAPDFDPVVAAPVLCRRGLGIGADGLLLVETSAVASLRLTYFNADGSRAFCGNGTLCVARWAHAIAGYPADLSLETDVGVVPARVYGERVEIGVSPPQELRHGIDLARGGGTGDGTFVQIGCPHLVVIDRVLPDDAAFEMQAPLLRRHPALGEGGANVDFVQVESRRRLHLRVFERGVEAETLASGTGCLAAALAAAAHGLVDSAVTCVTRGGEALTVRFERDGEAFKDVRLDGGARLVYAGRLGPDLAPLRSRSTPRRILGSPAAE